MKLLDRREFLQSGAALWIASALACRRAEAVPSPEPWRTFEVATRIDIPLCGRSAQVWLPVPSLDDAGWLTIEENRWAANTRSGALKRDPKYGTRMLHLAWAAGAETAVVEATSRIRLSARSTDVSHVRRPLSEAERRLYTGATGLLPVNGFVKETSARITAGAASERQKARLIHDWILDTATRDPRTRGHGAGDIVAMLKMGNLNCPGAALNGLYVGLVRAAALPAREIHGLAVARSPLGSGSSATTITRSQGSRAQVYLNDVGWMPVDFGAAPGGFGAWAADWIPYNMAHDVTLPGSAGPRLSSLIHPQAEIAGQRLDCLDPDNFKYEITAKELPPKRDEANE